MNNCINSSKVYCKYKLPCTVTLFLKVLIVAKCIVNHAGLIYQSGNQFVLIVAKCIVNFLNIFVA